MKKSVRLKAPSPPRESKVIQEVKEEEPNETPIQKPKETSIEKPKETSTEKPPPTRKYSSEESSDDEEDTRDLEGNVYTKAGVEVSF